MTGTGLIFTFDVLGLHDEVGKSTVKLYCPQCMEVYFPPKMAIESLVDGAYFGTGFAEMVFMTRPECRPSWPKIQHVSKIYGFKIHSSAIESQRHAAMKKVRMNQVWSSSHYKTHFFFLVLLILNIIAKFLKSLVPADKRLFLIK